MLFNTHNGVDESIFHRYVRPTLNPVLSDRCKRFTNISQSVIDNQNTFCCVYYEFMDWLTTISNDFDLNFADPSNIWADNNINATFCTWSNTDLKVFFPRECRRHNQNQPAVMRVWIDVQRKFKVYFH